MRSLLVIGEALTDWQRGGPIPLASDTQPCGVQPQGSGL